MFELWVAIDKIAVVACPLLGNYSPEVPIDHSLTTSNAALLHPILLQNPLISSDCWLSMKSIGSSSFAVKYFNQDATRELQNLKAQIEWDAQEIRDCIHRDLEMKTRERNRIRTRWLDGFSVPVHEWPLPEWRAATALLLWDVCTPMDKRNEFDQSRPSVILNSRKYLFEYLLQIMTLASASSSAKLFGSKKLLTTHQEIFLPGVNGTMFREADTTQKATLPISTNPSSIYLRAQLQYAVSATCHTSNQIIASQDLCPPQLPLHEYMSFASLRSGACIQWISLLSELRKGALSWQTEEVMCIIEEEGTRDLEWHVDLKDLQFGQALLWEMGKLLCRVKGNWKEVVTVRTIILLTSQLLASTRHVEVKELGYALMRECREVTWEWVGQLEEKLVITESSIATGSPTPLKSAIDKGKGSSPNHCYETLRQNVYTTDPTQAISPLPISKDLNPFLPPGTNPSKWNGLVDLRKASVVTPQHSRRFREPTSYRKPTTLINFDDMYDSDKSFIDGIPPGMSPPMLMSPVRPKPSVKLGQNLKKAAAACIMDDIVADIQGRPRPSSSFRPRPSIFKSTMISDSSPSYDTGNVNVNTNDDFLAPPHQYQGMGGVVGLQNNSYYDDNDDIVNNTAHPSAAFLVASQTRRPMDNDNSFDDSMVLDQGGDNSFDTDNLLGVGGGGADDPNMNMMHIPGMSYELFFLGAMGEAATKRHLVARKALLHSTFSNWPEEPVPPAMLVLMTHDNAKLREWAMKQASRSTTVPISQNDASSLPLKCIGDNPAFTSATNYEQQVFSSKSDWRVSNDHDVKDDAASYTYVLPKNVLPFITASNLRTQVAAFLCGVSPQITNK
ncbi:hypothetical protein BT96DRAFT_1000768 [Gymnopus androsaceus JB14]|uniref:Uncharacterized protein n=1 Tax=Gymnopus androsaceus JB14 TaxID=1447944 RepID=A0A6A4H2U9_9AGAR|nr:hypothetical protein BT96DRAFT_1000768 [Gymnopus androsaceus JB14]